MVKERRIMREQNEKRILVTGGGGFLGSHLCSQLLDLGHGVICLDNFSTSDKSNIRHLLEYSSFEILQHDVCQKLSIEIDEIYNLACPASPIQYQQNPVKTIKTNVLGAINLLELAKETKAKILQASTSEIYGDPKIHPQPESYWGNVNSIGLRSCYNEGKRCVETLFFNYHRQYNLRIKVARIFNTYGPNMLPNDGRVVSNFIIQALLGKNITIYGKGQQTRSFCFVDDLIEGLIKLMGSEDVITGPINLGSSEEITIFDLAKRIIKLTNSKSKVIFKKLPKDDPQLRCPDITMAVKKLNWRPKIKLEEGLEKTIEYFRKIKI